jgi:DNA-binding ferritin-like protein (Dps family)
MTVDKFQQNFTADYKAAKSYVWIFGNGTSWQSDKYGPVVPNFPQYLNAARNARKACTK